MLNSMLSLEGMGGYSPKTLFIQPYKEGWNNFKAAVGKKELISAVFLKRVPSQSTEQTWSQSIKKFTHTVTHFIKHFAVGTLLWIPLINTITILFLRNFNFNCSFDWLVEQAIGHNILNNERLSPRFIETKATDQTPVIAIIRENLETIKKTVYLPHAESHAIEEFALHIYLHQFLNLFIHPYVTGRKDPLEPRQSVVDAIRVNIKFFDPHIDFDHVQDVLLDLYIEKNILILEALDARIKEANPRRESRKYRKLRHASKNNELIRALSITLPIDFPNLSLSMNEFSQKLAKIKAKIRSET